MVVRVVVLASLFSAAALTAQIGTPAPSSPAVARSGVTHALLEAAGMDHGESSLALERIERLGLEDAMRGADDSSCTSDARTPDLDVACGIRDAVLRYGAFTDRVRHGSFLPLRSHFDAISFWKEGDGSPEVLRTGSLLLEDDLIATDLEILSDLIGSMRIGLGVTVVSQSDADEGAAGDPPTEDLAALSRLANTGGTVHLSGSFPVFYRAPEGERSVLAAMLVTRAATESPEVGGYLENPALSGSLGLDLTYYRPGLEQMIDIELGASLRGYAFNRAFQEKIGTDATRAGLVALRAGVVIARRTMLSITWRLESSAVFRRQSDLVISLQTVRR